MGLFQLGRFRLASGQEADWRIECDALGPDDWRALAAMAVRILPPFGDVEGVPRGGLPFAEALFKHRCEGRPLPLLIAEDVVNTGGSMERFRAGRDAIGVCVFARGPVCPPWVTPLFACNVR